ncbi:MAG: hypothetical protein FWH55_10720, partial [Oscillospiraceae bacterium]|nr:hypothetical protein [Oscillospiraceae bacterium]
MSLGAWRVHGLQGQAGNFAGRGALAGRNRGAGNAQSRYIYSGIAGSGIVLNLTSFSVNKDIVSGKDFSARKLSTAFKRRYIKGFQPSRCGNIATEFPSGTPLICLMNSCPPRAFGFRHPIAILSQRNEYYPNEARNDHSELFRDKDG